jgi:hypothetical protein
MSRKFILAIAAVAALGMSTLTDASARGGGGGGGFHGGGGGHMGGGHSSFSRTSFSPSRVTTNRTMGRTVRTPSRTTHFRPNTHRPNPQHAHHNHYHHGHHWWAWCRHHHHYRCGYPWIDVGVIGDVEPVAGVIDAPQPVAARPAASVCTNDCDYFLNDEPGCYMAKRAFSTPAGDELRCVKICEEPQHAAK